MGALLIPAYVPTAFSGVVYAGFDPCESSPAPINRIDAALKSGKPVIVQVDWNPQAGIQTHWVVLKEKKGGDYVMYDPYKYRGDSPEKELLLTDRYFHQGKDVADAITAVVWLEKSGSVQEPPKQEKDPVPADAVTVYVAEADLALRAEPSVAGNLIKRIAQNTPLISLESKDNTLAKLGKVNKWLHVQDPAEDQGYSAAWYLAIQQSSPEPEPEPEPTPVPEPVPSGALNLVPTVDGLSLRTRPLIAPETTIKHLPISATLTSLETAAQTAKKVGVNGEWIQVRDNSGQQGYVAAWYVIIRSGSASSGGGKVGAGDLEVRTTVDGVALRKQPVIADHTLITRLGLGVMLRVTEAGGEAKIGQYNQWLQVRDSQGNQGYVAAWYISR
jgi:hypothetical protein